MEKNNFAFYLFWAGILAVLIAGGYLFFSCEVFTLSHCPSDFAHNPILQLVAGFVTIIGFITMYLSFSLSKRKKSNDSQTNTN